MFLPQWNLWFAFTVNQFTFLRRRQLRLAFTVSCRDLQRQTFHQLSISTARDAAHQTDRHPSNGLFPRATWVSRHQKGSTNLDLNEEEMMAWQWHQLDHMQIIFTSLQTANHAST